MEPPYTNFTAHFVGTLDYMWYKPNPNPNPYPNRYPYPNPYPNPNPNPNFVGTLDCM